MQEIENEASVYKKLWTMLVLILSATSATNQVHIQINSHGRGGVRGVEEGDGVLGRGEQRRRVHGGVGEPLSPPTSLSTSAATRLGSVISRFNSYLSLLYALCKRGTWERKCGATTEVKNSLNETRPWALQHCNTSTNQRASLRCCQAAGSEGEVVFVANTTHTAGVRSRAAAVARERSSKALWTHLKHLNHAGDRPSAHLRHHKVHLVPVA
jgi:hypothetical protein